jgi:hypothetical protein
MCKKPQKPFKELVLQIENSKIFIIAILDEKIHLKNTGSVFPHLRTSAKYCTYTHTCMHMHTHTP